MSNHETTERIVLCFDRDRTISVNAHPDHRAVPIGWLQFWAHETEIPVWATGNQHLKSEAEIPGLAEAESLWEDCLANDEYEYENSEFENHIKPRRRDGLRLVRDVYGAAFPDHNFRFVVVDDADVSDLAEEGPWTWYAPWDFVEAVESGDFTLEEPPSDAYRNDGVPFNSTDNPDFNHNQNAPLEEIRAQVQEGRPEIEEELQTPNSPGE